MEGLQVLAGELQGLVGGGSEAMKGHEGHTKVLMEGHIGRHLEGYTENHTTGRTENHTTGQDRTEAHRTGQDRTVAYRMGQDRSEAYGTGQDRTRLGQARLGPRRVHCSHMKGNHPGPSSLSSPYGRPRARRAFTRIPTRCTHCGPSQPRPVEGGPI